MKNKIKRSISAVLIAVMVFSMAPLSGFVGLNFDWLDFSTRSAALDASGSCGKNVTYTFDESTGLLTISGTGAMYDHLGWGIAKFPFDENTSIITVVIENGVTRIGKRIFNYCTNLTSIIIPDSVTSIGDDAFIGCSSLTSITIPDSVTSIGKSVFDSCTSLESVTVDENNTVYDSRNNCNAIIETSTNTLIQGCKNTIIPDSVTSIGYCAFAWCTSLTSITIPDSVKSLGDNAFNGCAGLTSITIPNSVTSIGVDAFCSCSSLTSITIPDNVTSIGNYAFSNCTGLTSIVVDKDNNVYDSRDNCNAIIEISTNTLIIGCKNTVIPDSVTSIGGWAFRGCTGLTSIIIPDSVTSIGNYAFYDCTSLKDVYYSGTSAKWNAIDIEKNNECLTNATIHYKWVCMHEYELVNTIDEPNCTHETTSEYVCKICGKTKTETVSKLKHMVTPATCTQTGQEYDICTSCYQMINYTVLPATGHIWSEWITETPETCTTDGSRFRTCTQCSEGIETEVISANGHNYTHVVNPATCENDGSEYDICTVCFDMKNMSVLPTSGHNWSDWVVQSYATCVKDGVEFRICNNNDSEREERIIPATGHDYSDTVTPPTCEERGYTTHFCNNCGETEIDSYVEPIGHKCTWRTTVNPTTVNLGHMVKQCEYCGRIIDEMDIPVLVPDYVTGITISSEKEAISLGESIILTATVLPDTAVNKNVIWRTSDETIATVENGMVTAVKPGVTVITAQSEDGGYKEYCLVRVIGIVPEMNTQTVIDNEKGLIYGLSLNSASIEEYIEVVDGSMTIECNSSTFGTGTQINIISNGKIVDTYQTVIFGDADGDGWYDGTDSIIVNCLANGLLSREQVGEAVYMAADCNHDGVIDNADVTLLEQAGMILASVDQSKSAEELQTDSAYQEYINLIDQTVETENVEDNTTGETDTTTETPVDEQFNQTLLQRIFAFFKYIFKMMASLIQKAY